MIFFTLKIILAAIIIAFASWLSGQNPKLAGFIIALPLVSLIAIAFSYYEHNDIEKTILFTKSILVAVPVSYLFFLPFLRHRGDQRHANGEGDEGYDVSANGST